MLEKHKDIKIEHRKETEQDQQWGLIGRQRARKGMHLYGYDPDAKKVYQVIIKDSDIIDIDGKESSTKRANVNPKHPMLWAINHINAVRKFEKYLKL